MLLDILPLIKKQYLKVLLVRNRIVMNRPTNNSIFIFLLYVFLETRVIRLNQHLECSRFFESYFHWEIFMPISLLLLISGCLEPRWSQFKAVIRFDLSGHLSD